MAKSEQKNSLTISKKDLERKRITASGTLSQSTYIPSPSVFSYLEKVFNLKFTGDGKYNTSQSTFKLFTELMSLNKNTILKNSETTSPEFTIASYSLSEGLAMGELMNETIKKQLRIEDATTAVQDPQYDDKRHTATTVGIFSFASYVLYLIGMYKVLVKVDTNFTKEWDLPEFKINAFHESADCILFYLTNYIKKEGFIRNEGELVGFVEAYFKKVQIQASSYKETLVADNYFEKNCYALEDSTFVIDGWEIVSHDSVKSSYFRRVDLTKICGNEEELAMMKRLAFMVSSYKPDIKQNVWNRFGKPQDLNIFYGIPGSGKTLSARALATMIYDLCEMIGIPFKFLVFPTNIKDKFVGETSKFVVKWLKELKDLNAVVFGLADDCESMFGDMSDSQDISTKDIVSPFLVHFDGAGSDDTFQSIMMMLTNNIEVIAAPLRSRASNVLEIIGPQKASDFINIAKFTLDKYKKYSKDVALSPSKDSAVGKQHIYEVNKIDYTDLSQLRLDKRILALYNEVSKTHSGEDLLGVICERFKKEYCPWFSGRAMDMSMSSVTRIVNSFPIPGEASTNPEFFFHKSIDEQEELINSWIANHLQNINFPAMVIYMVLKYMNDELNVHSFAEKKEISKMVKRGIENYKASKEIRLETSKIDELEVQTSASK